MFSIKVVLEEEVRRIQVNQDCGNEGSYLKLQETVRNIFPALKTSQFSLTWQDEEGDKVTASSDDELRDALQVMSYGEGIPRFTVRIVEEKASESAETPATHYGITCDECGMSPIQGARFKCTARPDFDLCATCEARQVQPFPMTKMTIPSRGCPRFDVPGGRGGFGRRGGFGGFHGHGHHGHGPHGFGGPHGGPPHHPHGGRGGGRGGWGGPRHGPRFGGGFFGGFEAPYAEATAASHEGRHTSEHSEEDKSARRQDTRRPVQTPWGPADIIHAYLDGKDILNNLMGGLGVNSNTPHSVPTAESTAAPAVATPTATASTEVPTPQPAARTLAEAIAEARTRGHRHPRRAKCGPFSSDVEQSVSVSTSSRDRDLNDEDEALQRAISESWDQSPVEATVTVAPEETVSVTSSPSEETDGVMVTAPEAVAIPASVEPEPVVVAPVAPAEPTHEELLSVWSRELSVLASMGFVDTHVLLPLLQTHLGAPGAVSGGESDGVASPTATHMEGMQRVVAELLSQMGVMF